MCRTGDTIDSYDSGLYASEDEVPVASSAEAAADAFLSEIRVAASAANPALAGLDAELQERYRKLFDTHYKAAQNLSVEHHVEEAGVHVLYRSVGAQVAQDHAADPSRWRLIHIVVREIEPGGFLVQNAQICTSQIVDAEGLLATARLHQGGN